MGYKVTEEAIIFYVRDTGIGISIEHQEKIFERFHQVETTPTRKYGGTGLGLSVSKGYVELLGGKIWVDSALNAGSHFSFMLPYKKAVEEEKTVVFEKNHFGGTKVLIAEDEETNFLFIKEILEEFSCQTIHVSNGKDAVHLITSRDDINLVFMDIKMPLMDGIEATKIIKNIKPRIPIIAQTAFAMSNDKINSFKAGCDDYITKPVTTNQIKYILNKYLHKKYD
jgi:CheY-like chemotaxis protein